MVEVIVFAEGPSDEQFIKKVVAPALREHRIFLKPLTLFTSAHARGGAISYDRLRHNVRNTLRSRDTTYLTTFIDLYALDTDMPGRMDIAAMTDPVYKALHIEAALGAALLEDIGFRPERLIPYVQPYELEGLFFSDVTGLCRASAGWDAANDELCAVRQAFQTPEHINDSYENKPSARLERLLEPKYRKTRHAPLIGEEIGLTTITLECPHFAQWVEKLRRLKPLR